MTADPESGAFLAESTRLRRAFDADTLTLAEFHHRQHLAVATLFLLDLPYEAAVDRMRAGLQRLLGRHGIQGYNEDVTVRWMQALAGNLAAQPAGWPIETRLRETVEWAESYTLPAPPALSDSEDRR